MRASFRRAWTLAAALWILTTTGYSAFNVWRYREAGPLTTLTAYSLTAQRERLSGVQNQASGLVPVLGLLKTIHEIVDIDLQEARRALSDRLAIEVKLADSSTGRTGSKAVSGTLLGLGVTAKNMSDVDRTEYDLRDIASLVAQLIIDTEEEGPGKVSRETYQTFNTRVTDACDQMRKLERAKVAPARWAGRVAQVEAGRRDLQIRWGFVEDRAVSSPLLRAAAQEQLGESELEVLGEQELLSWRKKAADTKSAGVGIR